jgi:hypothetical protein
VLSCVQLVKNCTLQWLERVTSIDESLSFLGLLATFVQFCCGRVDVKVVGVVSQLIEVVDAVFFDDFCDVWSFEVGVNGVVRHVP